MTPLRAGSPAEGDSPRRGGLWRGLTGTLAGGLAVLALVLLGAQLFWLAEDAPGPGVAHVVGHLVAATVAVGAQVFADRKRGIPAGLAGLVVLASVVVVLWTFWWG